MVKDEVETKGQRAWRITKAVLALAVLIVPLVLFFMDVQKKSSQPMDNLAQCITSSGATFYGAWWCDVCAQQKAMFGNSIKYINYVECSYENRSQNELCSDKGIHSYPTWIFNISEINKEGLLSLAALKNLTGCI